MLFCQSIDVVITNDTFYWFFLSKSPLSHSKALLDKNRSALLECAIHAFNSVSQNSPLFAVGGDIVKEIPRNVSYVMGVSSSVFCVGVLDTSYFGYHAYFGYLTGRPFFFCAILRNFGKFLAGVVLSSNWWTLQRNV